MFNEYVCKYLEMQEHTNIMVNVSLCILISQVPIDTSCLIGLECIDPFGKLIN